MESNLTIGVKNFFKIKKLITYYYVILTSAPLFLALVIIVSQV